MAAEEPIIRRVIVNICEPCIRGEGQECHTPGCILCLHRVDLPLMEELMEDADALQAELARVRALVDKAHQALCGCSSGQYCGAPEFRLTALSPPNRPV
jgi:hypothetical protein